MHKANHPAARGNGVVNYRSLIECSSSPKLGAKTTASVPEHSGWERPDIVRGRMLVPRRSDNSSWQMVAPPQACHRSGSAARTARFLGHLVLALAHRPSRRRGCPQLAERSVGSPCCRLSDRFRVSLLDDGALLSDGFAYASPSMPSAPMSLMARWAMASLGWRLFAPRQVRQWRGRPRSPSRSRDAS